MALARVSVLRLAGIYPAFFVYLLLVAGVNLTAYEAGLNSHLYAWAYLFIYPLILLVSVLMVRETYSQIFVNYPGIATFGRWAVYAAAGLTVIVSLMSLSEPVFTSRRTYFVLVELLTRGIAIGLGVLLLALIWILRKYPIKLHENVLVNCVMFSIVLLSDALCALADHLTSFRYSVAIAALGSLIASVAFLVWSLRLSRQGETRIVRARSSFAPGDEARLMRQLDAFNTILARAVRK